MTRLYILAGLAALFVHLAAPALAEEATPFDPAAEAVVTEVQTTLGALGFEAGTPDGEVGDQTREAIRAFQIKNGLTVDGEITPELVAALRAFGAAGRLDAAMEAGDMAALRAEAEAGAAKPETQRAGVLALRGAIDGGDLDAARVLAEAGLADVADTVMAESLSRIPPLLHLALEKTSPEFLGFLAGAAGDLETEDKNGMTALVKALHDDKPEMAAVLIAAGADVTSDGYRGVTPLHFAANRGHLDIARALLDKGAAIDAKDGIRGFRPIDLALSNGHFATAALLQGEGAEIDPEAALLEGRVEVSGRYGESGMIEAADAFLIVEFTPSGGGITRFAMLLKAPDDDALFPVILPETEGGKVDLDLGAPGAVLPVEGAVQRLGGNGSFGKSEFTQLVVGPAGRLAGSHLVALGDAGSPTSPEARAAAIGAVEVPPEASLYRITAELTAEPVE